ncbi:MAG: nuclear transport factor 2 family protein [Alphaproteobacteria bacterium]
MGKGLENVRDIYLDGIAGGNARAAVLRNTGHRYTQHSTGVADGAEGFLAFFEPFVARNPKRDIEIIRIFEDGPWVFCSAYQSLNDGESQWVTMDMFYTDPAGLILEHWDTIAPYTTESKSGEDMVSGTRDIDVSVDGAASKALVLEYTKQVLQEGQHEKVADFVADRIVQHVPPIGMGLNGLKEWLVSDAAGSYEMLFHLLGQGDFVVTYGKRHAAGKDIAVFDLYRVSDGKIVEHWMNAEEISPREAWRNSGKF